MASIHNHPVDQGRFGQEIRRQLDTLGVSSEAIVTVGKRRAEYVDAARR